MEKKQSSVEWLAQRFEEIIMELYPSERQLVSDAIKQAKAMHEQEHEDTWINAQIEDKDDSYIGKEMTFQQYYNETFGNGKETK